MTCGGSSRGAALGAESREVGCDDVRGSGSRRATVGVEEGKGRASCGGSVRKEATGRIAGGVGCGDAGGGALSTDTRGAEAVACIGAVAAADGVATLDAMRAEVGMPLSA